MKKLFVIMTLIMCLSFMPHKYLEAGISGSITPAEAAKRVWAISGTDSVSTVPVAGKFTIVVKAGNWNLLVEAIKPYKNAAMDNVVVLDNQPTDVGLITLTEE